MELWVLRDNASSEQLWNFFLGENLPPQVNSHGPLGSKGQCLKWTAMKLWFLGENLPPQVNSHGTLGSKGQYLPHVRSHESLWSQRQVSASCEHINQLCDLRDNCLLHVNSHETVGCTGQLFASCEQSNKSLGFKGRLIVCFMRTTMELWGLSVKFLLHVNKIINAGAYGTTVCIMWTE